MKMICLGLLLTSCVTPSPVAQPSRPLAAVVAEASAPAAVVEALPENDPSLIKIPSPVPPGITPGDQLRVTTWNVEHLGRQSFDLRNKPLLDDADVITFQEVDANADGIEALRQIKLGIEERTGHPMCFAISAPTDGREFYGYVWRDDRLAEITKAGEVKWHCGKTADVIRLTKVNAESLSRPPAVAVMLFKASLKPFVLASVHLVPTAKKPAREVPYVFGAFDNVKLPVIVAGDYNLGPNDRRDGVRPFDVARTKGFLPSLIGVKTSLKSSDRAYSKEYDNLWTRGFELTGIGRIDVFQQFSDLDVTTIRTTISDHAPVTASFTFERPGAP